MNPGMDGKFNGTCESISGFGGRSQLGILYGESPNNGENKPEAARLRCYGAGPVAWGRVLSGFVCE